LYLNKYLIFVAKNATMEIFPLIDYDIRTVLFFLFCLMACLQLVWILFIYLRLLTHKDKAEQVQLAPISVIISARNEEDNLFKLLPAVLNQDYPTFEVVVVNHQSTDDSKFILQAYQQDYDNLKVIHLEKSKHIKNGKKLPLTIGIKGAKYKHLLLTDADCKPSSKYWIKEMAAQFTEQKEIVLGYGPYTKEKGILNRIIRLDTVMIAMNYLSYAKAKLPYMGVGRNMGYTKSIFEKNSGFKSHYAIQSGDDDLFIQEVAQKNNYTVCLDPATFCSSPSEKTWEDWYRQKTRHFTTTGHYKVFKKMMLGIYPLSLILVYTSFSILCLNYQVSLVSLCILALLLILKWSIQGRCLVRLKEKGLAWLFPFWDLVYAILAPSLYYTSEKKKKVTWK